MTTDRGWELDTIEVQQDGTITVTLKMGVKMIQFEKPEFGIGHKGARSAALAEFVAQSWGGDAERLYRYYSAISPRFPGRLPSSLLESQFAVPLAMTPVNHNPAPEKKTMKKSPKMIPATESAIDDGDAIIAASWDALDKAEEMAITKTQRATLNRKIITSAVFGIDIDGVIDTLTRRPGQPRACLLKSVRGDDVDALLRDQNFGNHTID
jgi:hypothetical protein